MKRNSITLMIALAMAVVLVACGSGGDGGGEVPKPSSLNWETPLLLESGTGDARYPQIDVDSLGNAIVVWYQSDGTADSIYASRYDAASGTWGSAQLIESITETCWFPQVVIDPDGDAIAVWTTWSELHTNRYDVVTGEWGIAAPIASVRSLGYPEIAVDASGNAMVVWNDTDSSMNAYIRANRYNAVSKIWEGTVTIKTNVYTVFYLFPLPKVVMDSTGNAIAVWLQRLSDGSYHIYASRYDVGGGAWGAAGALNTGTAMNIQSHQIAMDSSGNAIVVWEQADGSIHANRYVAGAGWQGSQVIASQGSMPHIGMNSAGDAIAVWSDYDGIADMVYANRYVAGTGWEGATLIETDPALAFYPRISLDPNGNAAVVWQQFDGSLINSWSNNYVAGQGWSTAQTIEDSSEEISLALAPRLNVSMDDNGNAIAVWIQKYDGAMSVYANRGSK